MLKTYTSFMNLNPYAFYGINYMEGSYASNKIWTNGERSRLLQAMQASRIELEQNLGHKIMSTMTTDEPHVINKSVIRLGFGYASALGSYIIEDLDDAVVDYASEPVTVQITTETPDNIHVYHPTTLEEIPALSRFYAGTSLILTLPRYALLESQNNPIEGWDFDDLSNFTSNVLVKNVSLNTILGTTLTLINPKMGLVSIDSAIYGQTIYISYVNGLQEQNYLLQNTWVSFAHAKMDIQPTVDPVINMSWLWSRDIPKELSTLQRECPFGQFAGAYQAWRYASFNRLIRTTPL
jgi:hypothetical protein